MSIKLKALGAMIAAVAVLSGLAAGTASATTGGHFTTEVTHSTLNGGAAGTDSTQLSVDGGTAIQCSLESYTGTNEAATTTELTLTPGHAFCKTAGGAESSVSYKVNGCAYLFKIGKKAATDNTVALNCPAGKSLEIIHPNCTLKIAPQTFQNGAVYTAVTESGKPALTVDVTAGPTVYYEAGICIFLGTSHSGSLSGSFFLIARDTEGNTVGLEATGTEDALIRAEASHTVLTGTSTNSSALTFGALIGTVECSTATLGGTTTVSAAKEVTVAPAYSGCKGAGREVTAHINGCGYVLGLTGTGTDGKATIECPAGKSIETTIDKFPEGCTITIPAQTAGGVVDYKEEGAGTGRDLLLTWTLEGLKYVRDGCEIGGEGNNGTMSGSITLKGEDTSGNPKGIWIE